MNSFLISKLLNNLYASFSFANRDFLNPHSAHFSCKISVPFFCFKDL